METPGGISALFPNLYELTMLQAYYEAGIEGEAVFSLFVRRLPAHRNYLIACGLETVLDYLENFAFRESDIAYLKSLGQFSDDFLSWLQSLRFTGAVYAVPGGTPIFTNEPILEIVAPLPQAQVVETCVMNQIHLQTAIASKAARVVTAAAGRTVVDFGAHRMHGTDAALKAARAFHIAGVGATSNVLAGQRYGLPVTGTMAHSYIQAFDSESEAFRTFSGLYPGTTILVDTYDSLDGVRKVIDLLQSPSTDFHINAVRLDSGDLDALSREARRLLDNAGFSKIQILASGGLDEYEIARLVADGAPIDGFGVGTNMGVSEDAPSLDIAYKLCEYGARGRLKTSSGKPVLLGRKQIFRVGRDEMAAHDIIGRADEDLTGRPFLKCVMQEGERTQPSPASLNAAGSLCRWELARMPGEVRSNAVPDTPYPVHVSRELTRYQREVIQKVAVKPHH